MHSFAHIDGLAPDPEQTCRDYAEKLRAANPQLCLLGIGENGHLAFNDPGEADFNGSAGREDRSSRRALPAATGGRRLVQKRR